jgi:5-methylcytosine-specific restriction protein A
MKSRCRGACCGQSVAQGTKYCPQCQTKAEAKYKAYSSLYETKRAERDKQFVDFYNSSEWRNFSKAFKAKPDNVFCAECKKAFSYITHHVVSLKADWSRRFDESNCQALCTRCHSAYELRQRNNARNR